MPIAIPVTMLPLTVQMFVVALVKAMGRPEVAVAESVAVSPTNISDGVLVIEPIVWLLQVQAESPQLLADTVVVVVVVVTLELVVEDCKFAVQFAVLPPQEPAQVQDHGPVPEMLDAVPELQRFDVGGLAKLLPLLVPQVPDVEDEHSQG